MRITVADVIRSGRDKHPAFGAKWTPDAALRRFLTEYQQQLLALLADLKGDAVAEVETVALPLEDFSAGADLLFGAAPNTAEVDRPGYLRIHGGDVVFTTNRRREPLDLVSFGNRLHSSRYVWPAYLQGFTLELLGEASDWSSVARIDLHYFPEGRKLLAEGSVFQLPGQPMAALVAGAAAFLSSRAPAELDDVPRNQGRFDATQGAAAQMYLTQASGRGQATVSGVREVW